MTWCRLEAGLSRHPKTLSLAAQLGVSRREALGLLVDLFTWTLLTRPSGLFDGIRPGLLEAALDWSGPSGSLVTALLECGWLDQAPDGVLSLHGWEERAERWRRSSQEAERRRRVKGSTTAPKAASKKAKQSQSLPIPGGPTVAPPWPHGGPERRGEEKREPPPTPPSLAVVREASSPPACVVEPQHAPEGALVRRDPAPPPSASRGPIVDSRPVGGAVAGWSAEGRPLLRCAGQPSEVLQWDYLLATIGEETLVPWLVSPDAARRLSRVHPGSLHRAVEQGIARARPPTIADRLAADAVLDPDPRRQAGLAAASALCAAVGRIEERRARQIAVELATLDLDGDPLSADEVLGGVRAYAAERAVLRRQAKGGQVDPPEVFDVVHAVRRFARDERGKRPTVPTPVVEQPPLQLLGSGASDYAEGADEQAAAAIRRANGLERTDEDHQRGLESVQAVLRALKGGRG